MDRNPHEPSLSPAASPAWTRLLRLGLAVAAAAVAVSVASADQAQAQAIITNGVVELGVDAFAQLNIPTPVPSCGGTPIEGIRFVPTGCEGAAPGCLCEGWGIEYDEAVSGWANNAFGGPGGAIAFAGFLPAPATATVTSTVADLTVVHDYMPSASPNLYLVDITVTNTGVVPHEAEYRRVVDWDVEPTPFMEYVTIDDFGAPPPGLMFSCANGFLTPDPLLVPGTCAPGFVDGPPTAPAFFDVGAFDHGTLFDICVGTLAPGESINFDMYYGAAETEGVALGALGIVGATVYSLGQTAGDPFGGTPNTFILAFGELPNSCNVPLPVASCQAAGIRITESDSTGGSFTTGFGESSASATGAPGPVPAPSPVMVPPAPATATASGALHDFSGTTLFGMTVSAREVYSDCALLAAGVSPTWLTEAYVHAGVEELIIGGGSLFAGEIRLELFDYELDAYGDGTATTASHACDYEEVGVFSPPPITAFCTPVSIATAPPPTVTIEGAWTAPPVAVGPLQWMYEGGALRITVDDGAGNRVVIDVGYVQGVVTGVAPPGFSAYIPNGPCLLAPCA